MRGKTCTSSMPGRMHRRGSVYLVVLGLSMIVTILALGAIAAGLTQRHSAEALNDSAEARAYAAAAIDLGRYAITQDANWRTDRSAGSWISSLNIGAGTCSLSAADLIDGSLGNRPYDPVMLTGTGYKGRAIQITQAQLIASPTPIPALAYALFVPGQLHVLGAGQLMVPSATAATNYILQVDGELMGNAQCFAATGGGTITGSTSQLFAGCANPPSTVEAMYIALGTAISPGQTMQNVLLSPNSNPYGATNSDGVYVINSSSDIHIHTCRISGTLVVVAPGHNIIIDQTVLMQPSRSDYPVLILDGNVQFNYTTNGTPLSETALGVNFNPPGTPYNGATNSTMTDSYPSMISGLVDVKGSIQFNGTGGLIHGAVICESSLSANAVQVNSHEEIDYDPTLFTSPPQGYTTSVNMVVQPGSWARVTH